MTKEVFLNFATTQLAGSNMLSTDLSFSVTSGTGSVFPSYGTFLVTIDAEVLYILSRSGDTLTVGTRGFDGTSAVGHTVGATIQMDVTAYTLNHIWSNIPDTFTPDVPPAQKYLSSTGTTYFSPSAYDAEFDSNPTWTLYPSSPPTGTTFAINSLMQSHLVLNRYGVNDNGLYTAYQAFGVSGSFTATCKLSDAVNVPQNGGSGDVESHFFVSDSSNPTSSADSGNRFRMEVVTILTQSQQSYFGTHVNVVSNPRYVRCSVNISGTWYPQSPLYPVSANIPLYLRITYDGSGNWNGYVGDGLTYTLVVNYAGLSMTCRSMGFQFYAAQTSPYYVSHTAAIDFVRVRTGIVLPAYGG